MSRTKIAPTREQIEREAGPRPDERPGYTLYARRHRNRFGDCAIWIYRPRSSPGRRGRP
jgi:hypothetical protein